jgi:hypothetical protein
MLRIALSVLAIFQDRFGLKEESGKYFLRVEGKAASGLGFIGAQNR